MKYLLLFLLLPCVLCAQSTTLKIDDGTGKKSTQITEALAAAVQNAWPDATGRHVMLINQNSAAQTYNAGDLPYALANGNFLTRLAPTTNGFVLALASGLPAWVNPTSIVTLPHAVLYDPAAAASQIIQPTVSGFPSLIVRDKAGSSDPLFQAQDPTGVYIWTSILPTGGVRIINYDNLEIPLTLTRGGSGGDIFQVTNGFTTARIDGGCNLIAQSVNGVNGFTYNATAPAGEYLRGDATDFVPSVILLGDLPSNAFIQNQYTAQTSAGFNITAGAPAKTSSFVEATILNDATSSTNSINKTGLAVNSTGSWTGTSATNYGITLNVAGGGSNNVDVNGTSGTWSVSNVGDAVFNSIGLVQPVTVFNGGTGDASLTKNMPLLGGTTTTAAVQSVSTTNDNYGAAMFANGDNSKPTWKTGVIVFQSPSINMLAPPGTCTTIKTLEASGFSFFIPTQVFVVTTAFTGGGGGGLGTLEVGDCNVGGNSADICAAAAPTGVLNTYTQFPIVAAGGGANNQATSITLTCDIVVSATVPNEHVQVYIIGYYIP